MQKFFFQYAKTSTNLTTKWRQQFYSTVSRLLLLFNYFYFIIHLPWIMKFSFAFISLLFNYHSFPLFIPNQTFSTLFTLENWKTTTNVRMRKRADRNFRLISNFKINLQTTKFKRMKFSEQQPPFRQLIYAAEKCTMRIFTAGKVFLHKRLNLF